MKFSFVLSTAAATGLAFLLGPSSCVANKQGTVQLRRNEKKPISGESSCNAAKDKDSCYVTKDDETGTPCEWCVAGAIPSECMSQSQAKLLPEAVFECTAPSIVTGVGVAGVPAGRLSNSTTTTTTVTMASALRLRSEEQHRSGELSSSSSTPLLFNFVPNVRHVLNVESDWDTENDICDPSSKSISGYMDIKGSEYDEKGENKHLFFWMFEKRPSSSTDASAEDDDGEIPFIVWLTGGPGCSSTLALLTENGPCSVNKDGKTTTVNPYSWTEAAHVLWLDQPAGVGFSYGKETDTNEKMISEDAYYFLQAFFQTYPQYLSSPLYIVGESYGGHYAPSIAHRVNEGNKNPTDKTVKLNLSGLGIGNGLTAPQEQYKWYPEMGYNNSHGIRVFDETTYKGMVNDVVPQCVKLIKQCNKGDNVIDEFACQSAFLMCNAGLTSPYQMTGLNPYDIRKNCDVKPLCYDFSNVGKFLNDPAVKDALHVDQKHSHAWQSCNFGINMKFHVDWMKDFSGYVADLLEAGIPALIYAGDVDFICNYLGNKAWTYKLDWSGGSDFRDAAEHDWNGGKGLARTANGFTFLQVYDAGHMVPSDQPEVALEMVRTFVSGGAF